MLNYSIFKLVFLILDSETLWEPNVVSEFILTLEHAQTNIVTFSIALLLQIGQLSGREWYVSFCFKWFFYECRTWYIARKLSGFFGYLNFENSSKIV